MTLKSFANTCGRAALPGSSRELAAVPTRREGYQLSVGKESIALEVAALFFAGALGIPLEVITDEADNYALGDFRTASGATIECKGQPIDPVKYPLNFVEVFEITHNERHRGGLDAVAVLLGMSVDELSRVPVWMPKQKRGAVVGRPDYVSVSIGSFAASKATVYANYLMGGKHIYVYESDELMGHIKRAVPKGMRRGAGVSNDDTFSVQVPLADRRWSRGSDNAWEWRGVGSGADAIGHLRQLLL
jgi:hypothetical protein